MNTLNNKVFIDLKEVTPVHEFIIDDETKLNYDACSMIDTIVSYIKDDNDNPDGYYYKINGYINQDCIKPLISSIKNGLDIIRSKNQEIVSDYSDALINKQQKVSLEDFYNRLKESKKDIEKITGDWTSYELRYRAAKTCKLLSEYRNKYKKAYLISKELNEIKDFYWFRIEYSYNIYDKVHLVYAYIDEEINTVYVGRTISSYLNGRIYDHANYSRDTVYNYYKTINRQIPKILILLTDLNMEESRYYEDYYIKKYKDNGYNVLNSGNTGVGTGSVGTTCYKFWTYQTMMTDAFAVNNRIDLRKRTLNGCQNSIKYNWVNDYFWLELNIGASNNHKDTWPEIRIWLFVVLFPTLEKLKKYNTKCYNFIVDNNIQYQYFDKNGNALDCANNFLEVYEIIRPLYLTILKFLDTISKSQLNVYDTLDRIFYPLRQYDDCLRNALKCNNRKEFGKTYCMNSMTSMENNWLNDYFWFDVPLSSPIILSEEELYLKETYPKERIWFNVLFYKTVDKLSVKMPSIYNYIKDNLDVYYDECGNAKSPNDKRTSERIKDSLISASLKLDIEKSKQQEYYLLFNRYLGAYKYALRTTNYHSIKCSSAQRHLSKYNWKVDLFWMTSYEKFNKEYNIITQFDEQFCEERLYYNCIFYMNIKNLKEFSVNCYNYIERNNLKDKYFNKEGNAIYPKYNDALVEIIKEVVEASKQKIQELYNFSSSKIIKNLYKLFFENSYHKEIIIEDTLID